MPFPAMMVDRCAQLFKITPSRGGRRATFGICSALIAIDRTKHLVTEESQHALNPLRCLTWSGVPVYDLIDVKC
jgi:hypothetical protein